MTRKVRSLEISTSFEKLTKTEFWQAPVRFDKIADPLLAQLALGLRSSDLLQQAIVALAVSCSSEDHYKSINKSILNYMRNLDDDDDILIDFHDAEEDSGAIVLEPKRVVQTARLKAGSTAADVKITAVKSLRAIYERLGEEWLSMLPQLVPIVAELLEDDDENVETEVRNSLVPVIEGILGESLDRYLS
jgi:U3 small nucleolar RNA-associated protein 10